MFDSTQPIPLDYQLPADAYWHLIRKLRLTLPPPPPTDSAADLRRRDHAAIAQIAGLAPGNATEATLAAHFVAASEQWMDSLRLARLPETTPEAAATCRAEALSMMREARGALRDLQRMQATRRKLEADNVLCTRLDRTEHAATALMADALQDFYPDANQRAAAAPADPGPDPAPVPSAAGIAEPCTPPCAGQGRFEGQSARSGLGPDAPAPDRQAEPAAAAPRSEARLARPAPRSQPEPEEPPELDAVAEAEYYAILYPERAALIRRLGHLPADLSFGPPDDHIVAALITGRTPALTALDRAPAPARAA